MAAILINVGVPVLAVIFVIYVIAKNVKASGRADGCSICGGCRLSESSDGCPAQKNK